MQDSPVIYSAELSATSLFIVSTLSKETTKVKKKKLHENQIYI